MLFPASLLASSDEIIVYMGPFIFVQKSLLLFIRSAMYVKQKMPLAGGSSAGGVSKLPMPADARYVSAAGPASQPPWTQGNFLTIFSLRFPQ